MKKILFIGSFFMIISCGNANNSQTSIQSNDIINEVISDKPSNLQNELIVNENCVIFLWPDSTEIAKMQAENDEETYNEIIADMTWYPGIATEVLDSFKIKTISCDKEFIILRNSKNKDTKLIRKEVEGNMILFSVDKEPIFSSAIDFDRELTLTYFKK